MINGYDVIIIGGGPGGYAAAVKAGKLGLKTALVEKELVGGTCVNWGCVPTKALLKYAKVKRSRPSLEYVEAHEKSHKISEERRSKIEKLFESSGITLFIGEAKLVSVNDVEIKPSGKKLSGKNIIIASGSCPRRIEGVEYDGESILTVREALNIDSAPDSALIVGSGATGMEIATIWNSFGARVTVAELQPCIMGIDDDEISITAESYFKESGVRIMTGTTVERIEKTREGVEVTFGGVGETLAFEKVLIAVGINPNTGNLGLEELNVDLENGYIKIDGKMRTSIPNIYAVGDVTGKLALAFAAAEQGMAAVDAIAGRETKELIYENIPRCIFSGIEAAAVGLTEKQAGRLGYDVVVYKNSFKAYGKPFPPGKSEGVIKVIADAKTSKAIGAVMLGADATDQIAGPMRMIALGAAASEVINVVCNGR